MNSYPSEYSFIPQAFNEDTILLLYSMHTVFLHFSDTFRAINGSIYNTVYDSVSICPTSLSSFETFGSSFSAEDLPHQYLN